MKHTLLFLLAFCLVITAFSQSRTIPVDTMVITNHTSTINGSRISYSATTGTQPVWDDAGKPIATLYYTYYKKTGPSVEPNRPLVMSFNGGPGSASVWMHVAYTGPKILNIDDEGYPVQPYGYSDNPYSILDVADIVFINPVNTGYSRMIPADGEGVDKKQFFGINQDIEYLADWLNTFVTRHERWTSPKYIVGESYGGTRVSGLALELQDRQWMYLNGVIMVSPADYNVFDSDIISTVTNMPYFTAAAWYHKMLPEALQSKDLTEILPEAETFALEEYMPALAKGGFISAEEKTAVAKKLSYYIGLTEESILKNNLDVSTQYFWKDLLRDESGYTIGRLDSRYLGIDRSDAGTRPDYSAELTSWLHSFTPAINHYIREGLNFKTDIKYNMFGSVHPWDDSNNNVRDNLREAMASNPYLNVLFQVGYYDGACTYFASKYTMWQIDPSGKMQDRFSFKGYRSGHMMYLRREDLKSANEDIRKFIKSSSPGTKSAKY